MLASDTKTAIIARLSPKKPHKVIIFGSQALQGGGEGSDIDLIVVLDKEGIPGNYKEKTENYLEVSRLLRDLNKQIAIDLVVMTRAQWEQFIEMDSGFSSRNPEQGVTADMKPAVSRWLQLAELDLKAAKVLRSDAGLTPVVCFHAQQCVEKSLKALIESKTLNPPKSHDLVLLHARVSDVIQLDEDLLSKLNQVYIDARYPASLGLLPNGLPDTDDAGAFYDYASQVKKILR